MADDETGYNGWTNYETWVTALWVDNEQGTYNARVEFVREWLAEDDGDVETRAVRLGDALKDWIEEWPVLAAVSERASIASDLLGAALAEINWKEIAENWMAEVES